MPTKTYSLSNTKSPSQVVEIPAAATFIRVTSTLRNFSLTATRIPTTIQYEIVKYNVIFKTQNKKSVFKGNEKDLFIQFDNFANSLIVPVKFYVYTDQ